MAAETCLLVEGRGCWRVYPFHDLVTATDGSYRIPDSTWRRLPFFELPDHRDDLGRRVLRADQPAIGPRKSAWHPMYQPEGWLDPRGQ